MLAVNTQPNTPFNDTLQVLSSSIRTRRKGRRLSQQALAREAGVGKTVVFDIEKGKSTVRLLTLLKILKAVGLRLDLSETEPNSQRSN